MNEERIRKLLPIGSVVMIRDAQKAVMIFGVCQTAVEKNELYDYIGVLWPEGNMGAESQLLFNHADVDKVLFRGLDGIQRDQFIDMLVEYYKDAPAQG